MEKLSDEYIAGLFDGEGCVSSTCQYIKGKYEIHPRINIQLSITNQHRGVLCMVMDKYDGVVTDKEIASGCWVWRLVGKDKMERFLNAMLPHSVIKRRQIELALMYIKTVRQENLGCVPLSYETHQLRKYIHEELIRSKNMAPTDGDISKQSSEIAGTSLWENPQGSLFKLEEPSETIMEPSQKRDDGIVRTAPQDAESGRNDHSTLN